LNKKFSDKQAWENFLSNNETLPNKDIDFEKKRSIDQFTFDFHGYSLDEANKKVFLLINDCFQNGIKKLVIVTGKGIHSKNEKDPYVSKNLSILKYSIPEYIKNNLELMDKIIKIEDAKQEDGGSGAFYIFLKKKL
tara:strand:+ start:193 stop:600 length:408 start_codon:yes stop_codon:yes gene_type:complete